MKHNAGERLANSAIRCGFMDTVFRLLCTRRSSRHRWSDAASRFPPPGPRRAAGSPTSTVRSRRSDSLLSVLARSGSRRWPIPRVQAVGFVSPVASACRTTGNESGYSGLSSGSFTWRQQGLPSSRGTPISICSWSSTPVGRHAADPIATAARLPLKRGRKLRRDFLFRGSITWLLDSLSTLRNDGYPFATQDSLPAAGQALPGGIGPLGSYERFQLMAA